MDQAARWGLAIAIRVVCLSVCPSLANVPETKRDRRMVTRVREQRFDVPLDTFIGHFGDEIWLLGNSNRKPGF